MGPNPLSAGVRRIPLLREIVYAVHLLPVQFERQDV